MTSKRKPRASTRCVISSIRNTGRCTQHGPCSNTDAESALVLPDPYVTTKQLFASSMTETPTCNVCRYGTANARMIFQPHPEHNSESTMAPSSLCNCPRHCQTRYNKFGGEHGANQIRTLRVQYLLIIWRWPKPGSIPERKHTSMGWAVVTATNARGRIEPNCRACKRNYWWLRRTNDTMFHDGIGHGWLPLFPFPPTRVKGCPCRRRIHFNPSALRRFAAPT